MRLPGQRVVADETIFDQPGAEAVHAQFDGALETLERKLLRSFAHLENAHGDP